MKKILLIWLVLWTKTTADTSVKHDKTIKNPSASVVANAKIWSNDPTSLEYMLHIHSMSYK